MNLRYDLTLCDLYRIINENFQLMLRLGIKESNAQVFFGSLIVNNSLEEVMR